VIGILDYAAYVPISRLAWAEIARAWARSLVPPQGSGERAVANFDEDSLTLAAEAALRCLEHSEGPRPEGIYFASTTAPDQERQAATVIAAAADLPREIRTVDFAGSLRAGTSALLAALDAVKGGPAWSVLVAAADCRLAEPGQTAEAFIGDGAAAYLIGEGEAIATVEAVHSIAEEFPGTWRRSGNPFIENDDEKFAATYGYQRILLDAMRGLLEKAKLTPKQLSKVVCPAPDLNSYTALAKASGIPLAFLQDPLLLSVGFTGAACPLLLLTTCLERAEPGQLILLLSYGGGADAILLSVTDQIDVHRSRARRPLLGPGRPLASYQTYLRYRDLVRSQHGLWEIEPFSSLTMMWREGKQNLALYGVKCTKCEAVFFPARRVCPRCETKDAFEPYKLGRRGKLVTFSKDRLYPSPESPTVMAVIDLEGGGRFFTQMADCDPDAPRIGMDVELTFRKFHESKGYAHYFWKARPVHPGP
jgi:3-hydroxy-3-methylglutaryl CoA synthase